MRRRVFRPALAFHGLTPLYDRVNDLLGLGAPFVERIIERLQLGGNERLFDVGCGTAALLLELSIRYPRAMLTGIDADPRVLHRAQQKLTIRGADASLIQGYAERLPFKRHCFDTVTSTLIFHHLSTMAKRAVLAEIRRVVRPGGRFLLADFGKPQSALQWTLLSVGRLFDGIESTRANLEGRLPAMIRDAGFQVEEVGPRYRAVQFLRAIAVR
jgi:ubiquinone/menaquinone biosynthesis C-methylase UbiE